jgi:hypothetical protein
MRFLAMEILLTTSVLVITGLTAFAKDTSQTIFAPKVQRIPFGQLDVLFAVDLVGSRAAAGWGDRVALYERGTEWKLASQIKPATGGDVKVGFGRTLALGQDAVVVGQLSGFERPSVFVYERERNAAWKLRATLLPKSAMKGLGGFGASLAISNSGPGRALVGDPGRSRVYVYEKTGAAWRETSELRASDGPPEGSLGGAVAVRGDLAAASVELGAPHIYIFSRQKNGRWREIAKLSVEGEKRLGSTLRFASDKCLVSGAFRSGKAYVFCREGGRTGGDGGWKLQATLSTANSGRVLAGFGSAIGAEGDRVVVANLLSRAQESPVGELYHFQRKGASEWQATDMSFIGRPDDVVDRDFGRLIAFHSNRLLAAGLRHLYFVEWP